MEGYEVKRYGVPARRYCQTLDLRHDPELIAEYQRLHGPEGIWPEILQGIKRAGVLEIEIYLLGTRLFMIVDLPADRSWDDVMACMARQPRQAEWEALTARFQQAAADARSEEKWQMMQRIFYLYPDK